MNAVKLVEAIVPELRFSSFREHWKKSELADIASIQRGRFSPRPRNNPIYYGGEIPFVQTSDVVNSGGRIRSFTQTLNEKGLEVSKLFPKGTILITIAANIGYTGVLQIDMACPDSLVGISCNPEVHNYFLDYLLQKEQPRMDYLAVEAAQKNINIGFLEVYVLTLPTLPEQRKIADFLTAVDGRIGQLIQKKALLEDYKKGVMQQLFTQAIRFKDEDGNDFPDWEENRYDAVYSFKNTNSYSRDLLCYENGEIRNIHYGDIHTKFRSNFVLKNELVPFIKPEVELKRISDDCYLRIGDLVIADASEDYNDVGKCIEVRDLNGERTLAGLHTFIARPKKGAMAPGFGGYLMQSREVRLKIMTIAQGTKVLGISKTQLCKVLLPIPSHPEQTKIANFLSAIDRKIEIVATQITETQTFKRGLLQQMFV